MPDAAPTYKKLPGTGSGAFARHRLWEGPDHLLVVTSWPTGEGYKRFFFTDIQAVIIRRTARRMVTNILLIILAAISAGPLFALGDGETRIAGIVVGAIWLLFIVINSLLGPTCETRIQTAVQTESIASLTRLRKALKVLARVQPRIVAAQGEPAPVSPQM